MPLIVAISPSVTAARRARLFAELEDIDPALAANGERIIFSMLSTAKGTRRAARAVAHAITVTDRARRLVELIHAHERRHEPPARWIRMLPGTSRGL